jgi:hypothetical protein
MDVVSGDFSFDFKTGQVKGAAPGRHQGLDPSIANEGQVAVPLSEGDGITYNPPSVVAAIPDWSEYKSIKKYFHRTGYQAFPAWFYHPDGKAREFRDAEEASKVGVFLRRATFAEKGQGSREFVFDTSQSVWSPIPYPDTQKFDPQNPGQGKTYLPAAPNPRTAQNELLSELIPTVTAAVVGALKAGGQATSPAHIDPNQWDEFLAFQAWKKTQEIVQAPKTEDPERAEWEAKAKEAVIKIDGRWSLPKLREHIVAELQKRVQEAEVKEAERIGQDVGDYPVSRLAD